MTSTLCDLNHYLKDMKEGTAGHYGKYAANIALTSFVSCLFLLTLLDTLGVDTSAGFNKFYLFWTTLAVLLHICLLSTRQIEYPRHKEGVWEARARRAGELSFSLFWGLMIATAVLVALAILLKAILGVYILDMEYSHRLIFLVWAACSIALNLPFFNKLNAVLAS